MDTSAIVSAIAQEEELKSNLIDLPQGRFADDKAK